MKTGTYLLVDERTQVISPNGPNAYYGYTPYTYPHPLRGGKPASITGKRGSARGNTCPVGSLLRIIMSKDHNAISIALRYGNTFYTLSGEKIIAQKSAGRLCPRNMSHSVR